MTSATVGSGRYIPWLFVAGFAVVVAVNAIMIWFAVGSFSGLYAQKPRDRGLRYNEVVAEQKARDALGWRLATSWHAGSNRLEVAVVDAAGAPLPGASIAVELIRPAEKRPPIGVAMAELGESRFGGHVELPARGNWDVDIVVVAGGKRFAQTQRMFLK